MITKLDIPDKLIQRLASAKHVAVLTGAGVSAESGIQTFRDPDGLWSKLNPAELASMDGFLSNPDLVWSWYQHRRSIINESKPNPGHFAANDIIIYNIRGQLICKYANYFKRKHQIRKDL